MCRVFCRMLPTDLCLKNDRVFRPIVAEYYKDEVRPPRQPSPQNINTCTHTHTHTPAHAHSHKHRASETESTATTNCVQRERVVHCQEKFFTEFAAAWTILTELGCEKVLDDVEIINLDAELPAALGGTYSPVHACTHRLIPL